VALAAGAGLRPAGVVSTLLAEAACAVLAALALAAATLPRSAVAGALADLPAWGRAALLAAGAAAALAAAYAGLRARAARIPSAGAWAACVAATWFVFLLLAAAAALLGGALLAARLPLAPLAGLLAVAWVAGFVVPGAPAGLGVREAVLVAGLGHLTSPGVALALPLLLRLVTVLGDAAAFPLGALLAGRVRYKRAAETFPRGSS